jgi:hypothetical protein
MNKISKEDKCKSLLGFFFLYIFISEYTVNGIYLYDRCQRCLQILKEKDDEDMNDKWGDTR